MSATYVKLVAAGAQTERPGTAWPPAHLRASMVTARRSPSEGLSPAGAPRTGSSVAHAANSMSSAPRAVEGDAGSDLERTETAEAAGADGDTSTASATRPIGRWSA